MSRIISDKIIAQKVLNEYTGELESKEYREIKESTGLKGGFHMSYKPYKEALKEIIKSNLDIKMMFYIEDKFTYKQTEVALSPTVIAKAMNTSKPNVAMFIAKLVESKLLKRIERGVYRLNPYMYLPYHANGAELQKEWNTMC